MMAVELPQNEEMSAGGKKEKEKMSVLLSVKKEPTGGAMALKKGNEEK